MTPNEINRESLHGKRFEPETFDEEKVSCTNGFARVVLRFEFRTFSDEKVSHGRPDSDKKT